jgi:DNA invertase Pin-like site-specific DNA recombinase
MKRAKKEETAPEGFLVGYARVSTQDQNLDLQTTALIKAGVKPDNLHVEKISATAKNRPALDLAIKDLRAGDTLLVWRLDRFARSMRNLYAQLDRIYAKGAKFKSLTENFDFDTFTGKFVLGILGLVAELERQLIAHRTSAGIKMWKEKTGESWGRQLIMDEKMIVKAGKLLNSGMSGPKVAAELDVSTGSIYPHWKANRKSKRPRFIRQYPKVKK